MKKKIQFGVLINHCYLMRKKRFYTKEVFSKNIPRNNVSTNQRYLSRFIHNKQDFMRLWQWTKLWPIFQSGVKTVVSAEWREADKTVQNCNSFWDVYGIIYIGHLQKGKYTNSEYYMELLGLLKDEIVQNFRTWKKLCTVSKTIAKLHEIWIGIGSPITKLFRPSSQWLMALLISKSFSSNENVIAEIEADFEDNDNFFYKHCIEKLEKCWTYWTM